MTEIKVVSRASRLALLQVKEAMLSFPEIQYSLTETDSLGDKDKKSSLMGNIPSDFFTRELDEAVLSGEADLAVHSAKDLPYPLPEGLIVAALLPALDQSDSLATTSGVTLNELPAGARIGTSSSVRMQEITKQRPDLSIVPIRGTIEERLSQLDEGKYDGVIIATCALIRLELEHRITEKLPFKTHPLQGHLALVTRNDNEPLNDVLSSKDCRRYWGKLAIAGFGPGNPELLTLKAHEELKSADVIFYDDLLDAQYIENFKAEKVYVGKRSSNHAFSQETINEKLWQAALDGKNVVRIKGGDPLIFGRGIEEYHYLSERLVKASIIPGISSALAAATDALVPLTARSISSSVVFLSGHDISKLIIPKAETLVFFMGASRQQELALRLIQDGWQPLTPVAIVQNASYSHSVVRRYTLSTLSEAEDTLESPVIIIVGWTAARSQRELPPRWMYTGTGIAGFRQEGMVIHAPLIEIVPRQPDENEKRILATLDQFNRIIFTSRYSIEYFFRWLMDEGLDVRNLLHLQIDVIGKTTAGVLREKGLNIKPLSDDDSSEGMLKYYREHNLAGEKILLPRSDKGLDVLPLGLSELGNEVNILTVYLNKQPENLVKHNLDDFYGVVFTAPSTVSRFRDIYNGFPAHLQYVFRGAQTEKRYLELLNAPS
jgi:uroporphyrinogen III methyltransferase / synthase